MFKIFLFLGLILATTVSIASPMDQLMTIKERLRISLWVEGIKEGQQKESNLKPKRELPEELERALKKM